MKEDFLGLTANLSISPKKRDLKRFPQRQASGYLAERKRILRGIVQSTSVKLLFWNALKKCWPIFTDNSRHVKRLVSPCFLCAYMQSLSTIKLGICTLFSSSGLKTEEIWKGKGEKGASEERWFNCLVLYTSNDNADDSSALQLLILCTGCDCPSTDLEICWDRAAFTVFHHLGAGKSGSYKGSHASSASPNLLPLELVAFLYKCECIGGWHLKTAPQIHPHTFREKQTGDQLKDLLLCAPSPHTVRPWQVAEEKHFRWVGSWTLFLSARSCSLNSQAAFTLDRENQKH